jgi:uncharacterized Zn finger protein
VTTTLGCLERKDVKCPECGAGAEYQQFEVIDWDEQAIYFSCTRCGQQRWSVGPVARR